MRWIAILGVAVLAAQPGQAQQAPAYPRGHSFIVQLTGPQYDSGLGLYLVAPLTRAFRKSGLRYEGSPRAEFVAKIETGADVGSWQGQGAGRQWLYERFIDVSLSPAALDLEPPGQTRPGFAVRVTLRTPDEDRTDELDCLIALAVRELAARYRTTGAVRVNGQSCARR